MFPPQMPCELCEPSKLCDLHLAVTYESARGYAAGKGAAWAEYVYREVEHPDRARPWPQTKKMAQQAHRRLATEILTIGYRLDDPRLATMLVRDYAESAARRWATLTRRYQ
jgi:hypothetical protein